MKISTFIVSLVLIGLIITVLGVFYANMATTYDQTYNSSTLSGYQQFETLQAQTSEINQSLNQLQSDSNIVDVVGGMLKGGFTVLKTTYTSVGVFNTMTNQAIDDAQLGSTTTIFKNSILLIVLILFLFLIVGVIVGRDI